MKSYFHFISSSRAFVTSGVFSVFMMNVRDNLEWKGGIKKKKKEKEKKEDKINITSSLGIPLKLFLILLSNSMKQERKH